MSDELLDCLETSRLDLDQQQGIDEIVELLSEQDEKEIERLEQKLVDVRRQLAEEREVLEENLAVIYRQIEEVQDQLRELDTQGYQPEVLYEKSESYETGWKNCTVMYVGNVVSGVVIGRSRRKRNGSWKSFLANCRK